MKFVGIRLCWDVCDMLILTVIVVARLGGLVVKRGRAEVEDGSPIPVWLGDETYQQVLLDRSPFSGPFVETKKQRKTL